jgi:hypothetical protein
MDNIMREFKTTHFTVRVTAEPEYDLDLSWDDDGSILEGLQSGRFIAFCAKAEVIHDELGEIATDYLGGCIYESFADFMDHKECGKQNKEWSAEGKQGRCGSYFADMIKEVCSEARKYINSLNPPKMRRT